MAVLGGGNLVAKVKPTVNRHVSARHISTLHSHIIRRPLSRALPRLHRTSSTWPRDNPSAGRGANTPLPVPAFAWTATGSVSSHERSCLLYPPFPPLSHPLLMPPFRPPPLSAPEAVSSRPPCEPTTTTTTAATTKTPPPPPPPPHATQSRRVEQDAEVATQVEHVESTSAVTGEVRKENNGHECDATEAAHFPGKAETERVLTHVKDTEWHGERYIQFRLNPPLDQINARDKKIKTPPLSRRVSILGFSSQAKFFAHALASRPGISIDIIAHHRLPITRWGEEYRRLSLFDIKGQHVSSAPIPCPRLIWDRRQYFRRSLRDSDFLDNVIVDTATTAVLPSLKFLRPLIDRRTTICFLHPGLGLVERLIEEVFPDPLDRPNIMLGYSTHVVAKVSSTLYSMKQMRPGSLYLHGMPKFTDSTHSQSAIAEEGRRQSQHLLQLLASAEPLNVVGLPLVRFLSWKLPAVIFSSVADTISVILGCQYNQIYPNEHAKAIWDNLLDEILAIVTQLPELQEAPHRRDYFTQPSFRRKLRTHLLSLRTNVSPWVKHVRMGLPPPIDYFNGYFIRRAKELGLGHKHNSMAEAMVKARVRARQRELRLDLLGTSPYMTDTDLIRGGRPPPSLEDTFELDFEQL
ncbi:hypothetical protein F5Y14DRAFT_458135 [Nemania sp. NC0429]|nr:hypothetical protein F5Y14DRAFT_458135 [Nemania sp. NC0429]